MKKKPKPHQLIRKIRKPNAPPSKVEEDIKRYKRAREREKIRREQLEDPKTRQH